MLECDADTCFSPSNGEIDSLIPEVDPGVAVNTAALDTSTIYYFCNRW